MPLAPPPLDGNGQVEPHDHAGIEATDCVIRRISALHIVKDEKSATGRRVSSMAFQPSSGANAGMSVDIEKSIVEAGLDPQNFVLQPPFIGAVKFQVGPLRDEGFKVGFEPLPSNPHHGEVWGTFSASRKKRLAELAQPFIEPMQG